MQQIEILGAGGQVVRRVAGVADPAAEYAAVYGPETPGAAGWRPYVPPAPSLEARRAAAIARIEAAAEATAARWITPGDRQAATYRAKEAEARAWTAAAAAGGTPDPADCPYVAARAARLGVDPAAVAAEWRAKAEAWHAVNREIEDRREAAKEAVAAAASGDAVDAVLAGLAWPAP